MGGIRQNVNVIRLRCRPWLGSFIRLARHETLVTGTISPVTASGSFLAEK